MNRGGAERERERERENPRQALTPSTQSLTWGSNFGAMRSPPELKSDA